MQVVEARKRVFVQSLLPLILRVNERILAERRRLISLRDRLEAGSPVPSSERAWLDLLAARYGAEAGDFDDLLRRVDAVPPSLALAQAAEESGWGTSRFARDGNALFGQYTYVKGEGIVPAKRSPGRRFEVKAFSALIDGVAGYAHNLNSHRAYSAFRAERAKMRAAGMPFDGAALAGSLLRYSERGEAYIKAIRRIIGTNDFGDFDRARLSQERHIVARAGGLETQAERVRPIRTAEAGRRIA